MKLLAVAAVSAFGVTMSGCASIMTGTTQTVSVSTPPVSGAECTVKNGFGQWNVSTPGQVEIRKSMRHALVTCVKPGYQKSYAWLLSRSQPWLWGNAVVPLEIGNIVDWSDGAGGKYPETISVPMKAVADVSPPPAQPATQPAVSAGVSPPSAPSVNQTAAVTDVSPTSISPAKQAAAGAEVSPPPVPSANQTAAGTETSSPSISSAKQAAAGAEVSSPSGPPKPAS